MAKFSRSALVEYIANHFGDSNLPDKTAAFLIDSGKASELESIMRDVNEYRKNKDGISEVTVRVAHALTPEVRQQIEANIKLHSPNVKKLILHEVVDKKLIGGVVLEFANEVMDASVRGRLNRLKEAIL